MKSKPKFKFDWQPVLKPVLYSSLYFVIPFLITVFTRNYNYESWWGRVVEFLMKRNVMVTLLVLSFIGTLIMRKLAKKEKAEFTEGLGVYTIVSLIMAGAQGFLTDKLSWMFSTLSVLYFQILLSSLCYYTGAKKSFDAIKAAAIWTWGKTVWISGIVWNFLKKAFAKAKDISGGTLDKAKAIKGKRKMTGIALGVIAGALALFFLGKLFYDNRFISVLAISPNGEVEQNVLITAEFSKPVELKDPDITKLECFTITPALKGKYTFENGKTVMFTPEEPLKPATDYKVTMDTGKYFKALGKTIICGKSAQFNTPYIKITDYRFFFTRDLLKNEEKEVVGEINFNYPIEISELKKYVTAVKKVVPNGNPLAANESKADIRIEPSEEPTRFYIRIAGFSRSYDNQSIKVKIAKGLSCPGCGIALKDDFENTVDIPLKIKLAVEEVRPWQTEGDTSLAVRFNLPVTEEQVKKYVTVIRQGTMKSPPEVMNFTVKTEYCYAVFTADFKPNLYYEVDISRTITARTGEIMDNDYKQTGIKLQDLPSSLTFAEEGEVLSLNGNMNLAIKVMNLDKIYVKVSKIFRNNLTFFLHNTDVYSYGVPVFEKNVDITDGEINKEVTEYVNLSKMNNEPYKGLFYVQIQDPKSYTSKTKLVRCTDIGLIAKTTGKDLQVKAVSIMTQQPLAGIPIKLMSYNNQVIKEYTSDESGKVTFKNWHENMYNFDPFLVLAENGDDFSYLTFSGTELNKYRFEVGGEPASATTMRAFLTSDRGLYRPGEKVNLTAIVRNRDVSTPPALMIRCQVYGPGGENVLDKKQFVDANGMSAFQLDLPDYAKTGEYNAKIQINDKDYIGDESFKVEEFIPDKLVVGITSDKAEVQPGSDLIFTVKGNQMFGPPAAGNRLKTEVEFVNYLFQSKTYKDYLFNDPEREYTSKYERLGDSNLNDIGEKLYTVKVPTQVKPPSALLAQIYAEVYDDGGRPVGAYASVPVHLYNYYLGVKLRDTRKIYKKGDKVDVDIVAINAKDELQKVKEVEVVVKRKVYYSIFRQSRWNRDFYNTSSYEEVLIYRTLDIDGKASISFDADVEGEYYVYVGNAERMRTGLNLNVSGPGFTTYDMTNADKVTIATDKNKYLPGDTARITIKTPFDGMIYLTMERDRILWERYVPVVNNSVTVEVPITDAFMPNAYFNAVMIRKPLEKYLSMPFVAYGVENIEIDKNAKNIKPKIVCKSEVMSTEGIGVSVSGLKPGTGMVIAAVDEGILQIIRFVTPDPLSFFYRKKSMDTDTYTMLSKLLTDVLAKKEAIGGDMYAPMMKHLNPVEAKNVESFARFSGILYANADGVINYTFETRKFNGKARVMALAVKGDMFGSDDKFVTVVDPIVITPTLPRFLALNDDFFVPLRIYNNTGVDGNFEIKIITSGPVEIEKNTQTVFIKSKGEALLSFRARAANEAGKAEFTFSAAGGNQAMEVKRELSVRPAARFETKVIKGYLEKGKKMDAEIPAKYIKYGKKVRAFVSYGKVGEYAAAFDYLVNYPYGCVEQTVSTAFPLLYFKDLGLVQRLMEERGVNVDYYVNEAIKKVKMCVMPDGQIEFWPGSAYSVSPWVSLYVAHFLIEARNRGYFVEDEVYNKVMALTHLSNPENIEIKKGRLDRREENTEETGDGNYSGGDNSGDGGDGDNGEQASEQSSEQPSQTAPTGGYEDNFYRMYLKSLMNAPDTASMDYYEELYAIHLNKDKAKSKILKELGYNAEKIKFMEDSMAKNSMLKGGLLFNYANEFVNKLTETDKFMLSMSYSQYNRPDAAKMVINDDFKTKFMLRELNGLFNSYTRNLGIYLKALAQAEGKPTMRVDFNEDELLKQIRDDGSFGSTHETAWALMGLAAVNDIREKNGKIDADIAVNGTVMAAPKGTDSVLLNDKQGAWKTVSIVNKGTQKFFYNIYMEGLPKEKNKVTVNKGLKVYKKYFNEDGGEANLTNIQQGKLIVVSIYVEALNGKSLDNVVVVDMLPAGFEIENPRLNSRGGLKFNPVSNFNAAFEDIRDDRILLFTRDFTGSQAFSYTVRAVTPGKFIVPNIYAEAMYDPDTYSESYEDRYLVVAPNKF